MTSSSTSLGGTNYLGHIANAQTGGLHTSFPSLKANLPLSCCVALTGIAFPIGLSYTLQGLLNATPVQAFAAGAALCSTSLGTTFTVLASSGLSASRLGVVLTSAAMMDDVVGLVMVQVISNLGASDFSWITVVRPVLVSVAFAFVVPIVCLYVVKPCTSWFNRYREAHPTATMSIFLCKTHTAFTIHTCILVSLVAGATYAGTSNLFAAYIAGATISWWDSEVTHSLSNAEMPAASTFNENMCQSELSLHGHALELRPNTNVSDETTGSSRATRPVKENPVSPEGLRSCETPSFQTDSMQMRGAETYERYYHPAVSKILQPFFFASIGLSIPISRMFGGAVVWRGLVYTILMAFGKLVCGFWPVRISVGVRKVSLRRWLAKMEPKSISHLWGKTDRTAASNSVDTHTSSSTASADRGPRSSRNPPKPFSLHPPLILALAMCARGEIGFLISGVAEANGIFSPDGQASADEPSDIFLVVTWAIVLCTIVGPLGVGLLVRRVRKLQQRENTQQDGTGRDVLGVWGVE